MTKLASVPEDGWGGIGAAQNCFEVLVCALLDRVKMFGTDTRIQGHTTFLPKSSKGTRRYFADPHLGNLATSPELIGLLLVPTLKTHCGFLIDPAWVAGSRELAFPSMALLYPIGNFCSLAILIIAYTNVDRNHLVKKHLSPTNRKAL